MPSVLLVGAFGQGNPGDEALCAAFLRALVGRPTSSSPAATRTPRRAGTACGRSPTARGRRPRTAPLRRRRRRRRHRVQDAAPVDGPPSDGVAAQRLPARRRGEGDRQAGRHGRRRRRRPARPPRRGSRPLARPPRRPARAARRGVGVGARRGRAPRRRSGSAPTRRGRSVRDLTDVEAARRRPRRR